MRTKTLLALSLAALCGTVARAQKLTVLPDEEGRMFMGQAISANGKYICGSDAEYGMFVADWAAGTVKYAETTDEMAGAELRSVSNDGVAVGYDGPAVTFDINGTRTALGTAEGLAESITPDGKKIVGSEYEGYTDQKPLIWVKGESNYEATELARPRDAFLGYGIQGATARHISGDGTTIIGYMVDNMATFPALAWFLNRDEKTYSTYPISHRFFESGTGTKPYTQFYPTGISSNGKWVAVQLNDAQGKSTFGRYSIEADSLYVPEFDPNSDLTEDQNYMVSGIADDGTMLIASPTSGIWKAGEKYPQTLVAAYPTVEELSAYQGSVAMAITPDARYIVGFGANDAGYETFVLDTSAESSVANAKVDNSASTSGKAARYTIDGRRVSGPVKGINIVVNPQGKARKVVVLK